MKIFRSFQLFLLFFVSLQVNAQVSDKLLTPFEAGGYNVTPTFSETVEFCKLLASRSPYITFQTLGFSARGNAIPFLIADMNGLKDPLSIRKKGRGIVLIVACIHPGEPDGKDAGLLLFRNIAMGNKNELELLKHYSILFIPVFNVDGHERFGPYTRINQNGPAEAGWRTTAQNLNLNRDFLKAEAPEMQHFLKFYHHWYPDFSIDCHTTNGADYQYVVTYAMETGFQTDHRIAQWVKNEFLPFIGKAMEQSGYPVFPYISFRNWHDPREAILHKPSPAIISNGYFAATNRPGLLIETHMLKPYKQRVEATLRMILLTLEYLNQHHTELTKMLQQVDEDMLNGMLVLKEFPVEVGLSADSVMIDFLGVRFEADTSDLTGGIWFKYYPDEPQVWKRPFYEKQEVKKTVTLPFAYIIPAEWGHLAKRLELHGIRIITTTHYHTLQIEKLRFENVKFATQPFEGCMRPEYSVRRYLTLETYPPGSYVVPLNQPAGRIIPLLLEPESMGSFVAWGYFNTIFEQKEYAEMYVMEKIARNMISENPLLMDQLNAERQQNPDLFKTQWNILNWFYQRSPWFDDKLNMYPVGRIMSEPLQNSQGVW